MTEPLSLNDRLVSQTIIDVARLTISRELVRQVPSTRIGVVTGAPDTAARKVDVLLNGASEISTGFVYGLQEPQDGDLVRVVIDPKGDRYVSEILAPAGESVMAPVNGLTIQSPDPSKTVLTIGTERPWQFEQVPGSSGPSAVTQLRDISGDKVFQFAAADQSVPWSIFARQGGVNASRITYGPQTVQRSTAPAAFPASPIDNDQIVRPDFDNTTWTYAGSISKWVGPPIFVTGAALQNAIFSASANGAARFVPPLLYGATELYVYRWTLAAYTSAAQSGSNFWTVTLVKFTASTGASPTVATTDTKTWTTAGRWKTVNIDVYSNFADVGDFEVNVAPTGTAGNLYIVPGIYCSPVLPP